MLSDKLSLKEDEKKNLKLTTEQPDRVKIIEKSRGFRALI